MNRKLTIYIVLIVLVAGLLMLLEASAPKPINWTPTYSVKDKIPFGLYVLDKEMPQLFNGQKVTTFTRTPYEFFDKKFNYDSKKYSVTGNFIAITNENELDKESAEELLYFAQHGNTVLLSMKNFPKNLLDSLKVQTNYSNYFTDSLQVYLDKSPRTKYWMNEGMGAIYFDSLTKSKASILGYQEIKNVKGKTTTEPNFIAVPYYRGHILLHTQPAVFSNFQLLKENHFRYAEDVLSYLPKDRDLFWSQGKSAGEDVSQSPLRYIYSRPALKWALNIGLIGLVVFVFFNAKRKQRIVPEIEPVRNTTVDFTKTIGNLYYMEGNHHTIIDKKIIYFLEHIRNEYLIDTYSLDSAFTERLHLKTGKPVDDIQIVVNLIKKHRHQFESTEADVITINKAIENLRL